MPNPNPTANNLAPFPIAWTTSYTGMHYGVGGVTNIVLDNNVLYNDNPTIRIDPVGSTDNTAREANGPYLKIKPGDHIVFKVYFKTSAKATGETDRGIRLGIDFYGSSRITGAQTPDGRTWTPQSGWPNNEGQNFVSWGTSTWTQLTMDFIVAGTYPADYWSSYSLGTMVEPKGIIPWIQVCSSTDSGQAWFAYTELYINP